MKVIPSIPFKSAFVLFVLLLAMPARSQLSLRVLHSFGGAGDGQQPRAGLLEARGSLYGTTLQGGSESAGIVFKLIPNSLGEAPLFNFNASSVNPAGLSNPSGLILGTDGNLYGTAGSDGASGYGSVFKMSSDGTGYQVVHSFDPKFGGAYAPTAPLVQGSDGLLYGTAQFGGVMGQGCAFRLSTDGAGFVVLHQFGVGTDGRSPQSPLLPGLDGALYGTTALGGASVLDGSSGLGTVFRLTADGTNETVLHSFVGSNGDGQNPYTAGLVQGSDGVLYGVTQQGGSTAQGPNSGFGTVFRLNPDGTRFAVLHNFSAGPGDGKYPNSKLVRGNDGALYGTTEYGGADNAGVVFRLNTDGSGYSVLYQFGSSPDEGRFPAAPLVQASDGGLFGTTAAGGKYDLGTVFCLAPAPPVISSLALLQDRTVRLTVKAAPNFTFRLDATSDHVHWTTLTNLVNPNGTAQFVDLGASNAPSRFYRAAWVP